MHHQAHALCVTGVSGSDTDLRRYQILLRTMKPGCLLSEPLYESSLGLVYGHGVLCLQESEPGSREVTGEVVQVLLPCLAALKELMCLGLFSFQLAAR